MSIIHLIPDMQSHNALWDKFVEQTEVRGRAAFEISGISTLDLGELVREMGGTRPLDTINGGPLANLWVILHNRFRRQESSSETHKRKLNAVFAAFAYSLSLRNAELHTWTNAAVMLRLDRESLFAFMLSAKFGIGPNDIGADGYEYSFSLFREWLGTFDAEVLNPKKESR